ncbi:SSU ribosomal protein S17p (S11e) [hydrothermal vent metagenome]|uniref:SSU ribosomal protein S17p (S11e) n=1 Tax=hydrothermal vent metagenome TaxID=652676 RepID=A0A3B1DFJ8_9ZZZZ|nr:30S ribosomal protein S17 [Candidatus Manganitrophaceae bacterium]
MKDRKEYIGRVSSNKMMKTVVVAIDRTVKHPRYKKYLKRTRHLKAHDETNACNVGDLVKVIETRPLSAQKRWVVLDVLRRAKEL